MSAETHIPDGMQKFAFGGNDFPKQVLHNLNHKFLFCYLEYILTDAQLTSNQI